MTDSKWAAELARERLAAVNSRTWLGVAHASGGVGRSVIDIPGVPLATRLVSLGVQGNLATQTARALQGGTVADGFNPTAPMADINHLTSGQTDSLVRMVEEATACAMMGMEKEAEEGFQKACIATIGVFCRSIESMPMAYVSFCRGLSFNYLEGFKRAVPHLQRALRIAYRCTGAESEPSFSALVALVDTHLKIADEECRQMDVPLLVNDHFWWARRLLDDGLRCYVQHSPTQPRYKAFLHVRLSEILQALGELQTAWAHAVAGREIYGELANENGSDGEVDRSIEHANVVIKRIETARRGAGCMPPVPVQVQGDASG
eukprot:CAMPEP_0173424190 /NCGR_PEP_ID=MMETSP1357-20121228/4158_1 /TAXON_ID=77926 /ORGANISM="Hemiselmis rufescens, Strain PCC563" /LENGTH=318 /DNA_ID=CAMNT_0014387365 /DNA_START=15 /DNA_END=971 /DNA_ORIENTATION=+